MKTKFSGMDGGDARRLRDLEGENAKLMELVADLSLNKMALCNPSQPLKQTAFDFNK